MKVETIEDFYKEKIGWMPESVCKHGEQKLIEMKLALYINLTLLFDFC